MIALQSHFRALMSACHQLAGTEQDAPQSLADFQLVLARIHAAGMLCEPAVLHPRVGQAAADHGSSSQSRLFGWLELSQADQELGPLLELVALPAALQTEYPSRSIETRSCCRR